MARKEMVPVPKPGVPAEQYGGYGDVPPWAYAAPPVVVDRPEWLELRPPHNVDSKWEHGFSNAMLPIRGACLGILWLTHNMWWFIGITGTMGVIISLLIAR